jgi:hypothetical protein
MLSTMTETTVASVPPMAPTEADLKVELTKQKANLPVVLVVTSAETHAAALQAVLVRKEFVKQIKAKCDPVCDAAHKAWKKTTELRAEFTTPVEAEIAQLTIAINEYEAKVAAEERERQRKIDEAARKAEEQTRLDNEVLMPWEAPKDVTVEIRQAVELVQKQAPPVATLGTVEGIGTKFKPWAARVTDKAAFVKYCLDNNKLDEYIEIDMASLNRLAKRLEATMSTVIPGVEAFRERTVSSGR